MIARLHIKWISMVLIAALALLVTPVAAQTTPSLPLAGLGPYTVGFKILHLTDASRSGRKLDVEVWYPAIAPTNPTKQQKASHGLLGSWLNASPDPQAAPYPLIIYTPGSDEISFPQIDLPLVSRGFVLAGIESHPNDTDNTALVDRPLDILFVLNQLTATNQTDFDGLIDTDHVGIMGFSRGAYTALALTGARIDPASAKAWMGEDWDAVAAYRATLSPPPTDALWPPFTDPRIHAALLFSACFIPMFGERGLAAATVPTLIIGGTGDDFCSYQENDVYASTHLGSQDRYLLTVVNGGHGPGLETPNGVLTTQFTQLDAAFFGYYLQGQQDDAQYLTAPYMNSAIANLKGRLVWGAYPGE